MFDTVQIRTTLNGLGTTDGYRENLAEGDVVVATLSSSTGVVSREWYLLGRPEFSTAGGAGTNPWFLGNAASCTFTVDSDSGGVNRDGTYVLQCIINRGSPGEAAKQVALARLSGLTIPSPTGTVPLRKLGFGETVNDDTSVTSLLAGWSTQLNRWFDKIHTAGTPTTFPLPALSKVWQFSLSTVTGGTETDKHRNWMRAAKDGMKGFASTPWTVLGSNDGVTAALDAVDRWISSATVPVNAWIVLKQTGIASNFQVCWHNNFEAAGDHRNTLVVSQSAGFTGGTTGARPTATDEVVVTTNFTDVTTTNTDIRVNVLQSTDGRCTRIFAFQSGGVINFSYLDRLHNPISALTIPWIGYSNNRFGGTAAAYTDLLGTTGPAGQQGATTLAYRLVTGAISTGFVGVDAGPNEGENELSSEFFVAPVGVASVTASNRGVMGELADFWAGSSSAVNGDTYPDTGTFDQFIHVGGVILPWNLTVPVTGGAASTRRKARVMFGSQGFPG